MAEDCNHLGRTDAAGDERPAARGAQPALGSNHHGRTDVLGIGTDLVDVDRFRAVIRRRPSLAGRVFTGRELAYAQRASDPSARLAARFAAKEAALKALGYGLGGMRMADIEVVRDGDGRPELVLHGAARSRAAEHGVSRWLVSLSHTDHLAQAVVIALGR